MFNCLYMLQYTVRASTFTEQFQQDVQLSLKDRAAGCLTTLLLTVFTQRNVTEKLGATYDAHLRLIGKHVVGFLLVIIELFSLGVMAEALRAHIGSKSAISLQQGLVDPKFQVKGVAPPPTILLLRKLG